MLGNEIKAGDTIAYTDRYEGTGLIVEVVKETRLATLSNEAGEVVVCKTPDQQPTAIIEDQLEAIRKIVDDFILVFNKHTY